MSSHAGLSAWTIASAAKGIRSRTTSSEALTRACVNEIERHARLNAFISVRAEEAIAEARRADADIRSGHDRGPLHGIPISLKDLIDLEGSPTTAGSRALDAAAGRDAAVVGRLRRAGAVFVGKCNLHEFAYGTTCEDSGFGPVRHPQDVTRSPGGSSGGSAAAVATGMSVASIGTDTGGSIRIPAAVCGVVGLKPGFGELPCEGIIPLSRSLDHVGPIARCVDDAWLLFHIMKGERAPELAVLPSSVGRLGVPRGYLFDLLDAEIRASFEEAVAWLQSSGAVVEDIGIPHASDTGPVYLHTGAPEASEYHAPMLEQCPHAYSPNVRLRLEAGRYLLADDYRRAQLARGVLRTEVDVALTGVDALILPAVPIPAPVLGEPEIDLDGRREPVRSLMLRLTQLFNLTGHPAISIPGGSTTRGLPWGIQLVGHRGRTAALLEVARRCERALSVS